MANRVRRSGESPALAPPVQRSKPVNWGIVCLGIAVTSLCISIRTARGTEPENQIEQIREINLQIKQMWDEHELKPSPEATDGEWCRRVYLDVIGRIPTFRELDAFLKDRSRNKHSLLVEKLLYDDQYTEEYARNWTTLWTNILIGRTGGNERRSLINREGMQKFLRDAFARNKPYDSFVYELVTAKGTTVPGTDGFNGATNFLVMKVNEEKASQATAATSRIFLGLQVQCTQCHNHPFNTWKQQKYWEMNAFFRQTRALRRFEPNTRNVSHAELVDQDFRGESDTPDEAALFYELRNGLLKIAYPVFVDGTEIGRSGFVEDVNRRTELADLMLQSEFLDKMIVNRMWSHFLGHGFTKPIDDLGPHNIASHPALLDYLGQEFRSQGYDLKQLMTWIALSKPYRLSSKTLPRNEMDDPLLGESPKFTHFYARMMRAEELYESLITATQVDLMRGTYEEQERLKNQWMQQFTVAFGTDEGDETTSFNGTIPQVLMMFNGDLVRRSTSDVKGGFLDNIVQASAKPNEKINHLFQVGLSRSPTSKEVRRANELLMHHKGNAKAALQDIWWAILNSNEFIFNH